ncbi:MULTISPECIES: HI1506-related protein [unclassified Pseudomonas]|uniref:HI1506-related protein n=1 Tax=unclassified Pseudomonas TaxID=196821 RepID=UPI00204ACA55|nr:MAG TPA: hypothetical protein [Caudoviricetes sp.]
MTTVIVITAKRNGFRRCGVAHSDQPTAWFRDDFTDEQWEELSKEPQLFLAVEERDFGLGLEQHNAFTSSSALPEAPISGKGALSSVGQADPAAVGNVGPKLLDGASLEPDLSPVGGVVSAGGGKSEPDLEVLWSAALLEEEQREAAKLNAETETLWDEAIAEDVLREAAKVKATKVPAKPKKAADK